MYSLYLVVRKDSRPDNDVSTMFVGEFTSAKSAKKFGTLLRIMASVLKVKF